MKQTNKLAAKGGEASKECLSFLFWNCQGLQNLGKLNRGESDYFSSFDVVCLSETWSTSPDPVLPRILENNYKVLVCKAVKEKDKGRASGGIIVLVKRQHCARDAFVEIDTHWIIVRLKLNLVSYVIGCFYLKPNLEHNIVVGLVEEIISEICHKFDSDVVIMGGDFNARIGNLNNVECNYLLEEQLMYGRRLSEDKVVDQRGQYLVEAMENSGFVVLNGRTQQDYPGCFTHFSKRGNSVIDLVWIKVSNIHIIDGFYVCDKIHVSDHLPCAVQLKSPAVSRPKSVSTVKKELIKWDESKSISYKNIMLCSNRHEVEVAQFGIDDLALNFQQAILEVTKFLDMHVVRVEDGTVGISWFDRECKEAKKMLRKKYRELKKGKFVQCLRDEYLQVKKDYKLLIKRKKLNSTQCIIDKLNNIKNPTEFWKTVKRCRKAKTVVNKRCGLELQDWDGYYTGFYKRENLRSSVRFFDVIHPSMDRPISMNELAITLKLCKSGKAPGVDGISNDFYKHLSQHWHIYMLNLFNKILNEEKVPKSWLNVRLFHIYKKGEINNPGSYRGIALVNHIFKLFNQILYNRIAEYAEESGILPNSQAGFRRGRGCEENVFVLSSLINNHLRLPRRRLYALFVDFKKAFDSVDHALLWERLFACGISGKIIRLLSFMYDNLHMLVEEGGETTRKIRITKGVLQGDPLSPILFSLYIAHIESYFSARGSRGVSLSAKTDVTLLSYADDLVLLADSPIGAKTNLKILRDFCTSLKLEVNTGKTKILTIKRHANLKDDTDFYYGNTKLETVRSYSYLGVIFSHNNSFTKTFEDRKQKARTAMGSILRLIGESRIENLDAITRLYNSVVVPTMMYCGSIWGIRLFENLEYIQDNFFKSLMYLQRNTPGYIIRTEFKLSRLGLVAIRQALSFITRVFKMSDDRLPKIALMRNIELAALHQHYENRKYNWWSQVGYLINHTCQIEYDFSRLNIHHVDDIMTRIDNKLKYEDQNRIFLSIFCPGYKHLHNIKFDYSDTAIPLHFKRCIAQLKTANVRTLSLYLNGCTYRISLLENCSLCNLDEKESVDHILFRCPIYDCVRRWRRNDISCGAELQEFLINLDSGRLSAVYQFLREAMKLRAFLLNL